MHRTPEQPVFGLDIGTRSLVGIVGAKDRDNRFKVFAMASMEHETRAMIDGQIHDIPKVSESIKKMKKSLETKLNATLSEVCIAAAGRVLKTIDVKAELCFEEEIKISDETIHTLEMIGVEKAYEKMRTGGEDANDYYCVGYSVMHYSINGQQFSNLLDHKGKQLEASMIATFLPQSVVEDLYAAVEKAGLQVANLTLEPIAAIDVAIPEKFRLLNIALVDVGAGTSDICVTDDGCVTAYGMIPHAGDEVTELIAKLCLVDFNTADQIKKDASTQDVVEFYDIMGMTQRMPAKEILSAVKATMDGIAGEIAEKIKELNGGKAVSAVFIVGGGGKLKGFTDKIAEVLDLPKERVALRGKEVLGEVDFLEKDVEKDPLWVTPIGICYSYNQAKNNFIFVTVNGERIKLYNNNKLTVLDALVKAGIGKEELFPKRGKELNFTIDGERRIVRGEVGDAALISVNGVETSLNRPIVKNDVLTVKFSTEGEPAGLKVEDLKEQKGSFFVRYNDREISCPILVTANGNSVPSFYEIQEDDLLEVQRYYPLDELLKLLDLPYHKGILVNQMPATEKTKVFENFSVYDNGEGESESFSTEEVITKENKKSHKGENNTIAIEIQVYVNDRSIFLSGKQDYLVVDLLDVYPFDLSTYRGKLRIEVNGEEANFTSSINNGDRIILEWI